MSPVLTADTPSPYQIRAELEEIVIKDLLGPAGGPNEIVAEQTVRGRYILGLLAPKGQTALLTEEEDLEDQTELPLAGADTQDGSPDLATARAPSMLPSSIGLIFMVDGEADYVPAYGSLGAAPAGEEPNRGNSQWQAPPHLGMDTGRGDFRTDSLETR